MNTNKSICQSALKIDQIIRSRRRTIGLTITADAQLIVRAPHWTPERDIERLVNQKYRWISKKQEFFRRRAPAMPKQFIEGEEFLFLGQTHKLKIADDLPKAVVLDVDLKIHANVFHNAKDHVRFWYKSQSLEYITQKVQYYAGLTDLTYKSIGVNEAKTRWGSCGHKDSLNFTWRLIMAPPRVVDYVVAHEVMHLKQKNHSKKFWAEVKAIIPDYKADERWLLENGHLLRI